MMLTLSSIVGASDRGRALVGRMESELDEIRNSAARFPFRPRVFFEEWNDPLISGIRWVEELVEIAGGTPTFPELHFQKNAPQRVVDPARVVAKDPEVIVGSWCGVKVNKGVIRSRTGWDEISAVRNNHIYEIKSAYILQPGPAALTEGVRQLHAILARVAGIAVPAALAPPSPESSY
jgi:iron complex transport system substrate-binding protein